MDQHASEPYAPRVGARETWAENRLGLDYAAEAARLGPPPVPIIDAHAHINGLEAPRVYARVAEAFGVRRTYSQGRLSDADALVDVLGDRVRFIAFPDWMGQERERVHRDGYLEVIRAWHERGARMMKLWGGPLLWDFAGGDPEDVVPLDAPWRVRQAELAAELGMMFMVHIADPDTWFRTKWSDAARYRTKLEQYRGLEVMVRRFDVPWIAAHMGGWPEDLDFLDGLLGRHPNLHLDTSATKWVVRELSRHPRARTRAFFERWRGRLLFGSDIVTTDEHLKPNAGSAHPRGSQAENEEQAFELYASRYFALRTLFETEYEGESPIADGDLAMEHPERFDAMSGAHLRGMGLGAELLRELYAGAAGVLEGWYEK